MLYGIIQIYSSNATIVMNMKIMLRRFENVMQRDDSDVVKVRGVMEMNILHRKKKEQEDRKRSEYDYIQDNQKIIADSNMFFFLFNYN